MPAWFPRSIFGTVLVVVYLIGAGIGARAKLVFSSANSPHPRKGGSIRGFRRSELPSDQPPCSFFKIGPLKLWR